jgi:hypothetical protein
MGDALRLLWDFDDLDATEGRFRALLARESLDPRRRADVLTQLARVEGLRGRFDEGERLVGEAEELVGLATARSLLERGRLRRSGGDPEAALPLFESAFDAALAESAGFVAADGRDAASRSPRRRTSPR